MSTDRYIEKKNAKKLVHYQIMNRGLLVCLMGILFLIPSSLRAQENPPKPITITVSTEQHLEFGTVIQAGGYGTVYISKTGSRTVSGTVYQKSSTYTPALFTVTALPGTLVTISSITSSGLHNGGFTLPLVIDKNIDTSTGSQFICTTGTTLVYVGGTLTVNSLISNPTGPYTGDFTITFIQQ